MLQITVPATESWDEINSRFVYSKEQTLSLEYSLVSIAKWEAKWRKPFLDDKNKTPEETIDFIRCMTLTQNVDPVIYNNLSEDNIKAIKDYIDAPMTATWFTDEKKGRPSREKVTAELVYYWMIALNIPMECQKWHFNRLMVLIRVCSIKNQPPKKMGKAATAKQNTALNAARRRRLGSRG